MVEQLQIAEFPKMHKCRQSFMHKTFLIALKIITLSDFSNNIGNIFTDSAGCQLTSLPTHYGSFKTLSLHCFVFNSLVYQTYFMRANCSKECILGDPFKPQFCL